MKTEKRSRPSVAGRLAVEHGVPLFITHHTVDSREEIVWCPRLSNPATRSAP